MCQSTTETIQSKLLASRDLPLVAVGLRTFTTGREMKRKNYEDAEFIIVQNTKIKTMHYVKLCQGRSKTQVINRLCIANGDFCTTST